MCHTAVEASPKSRGSVIDVNSRARTNASRTNSDRATESVNPVPAHTRPAVATSHTKNTV